MRFKDVWLKFGCFITGYNYQIILNSSEASAKYVKKNLAAFLIISILWGFIGYSFAQRYTHLKTLGAIIVSSIMVIIVVQVERQITMTLHNSKLAVFFRITIGIVMALIGSIILDQTIFKDDIEKRNISLIEEEINRIMPIRSKEIDAQIKQIDNERTLKESVRDSLVTDINAKPYLTLLESSVTKTQPDTGNSSTSVTTSTKRVINPKTSLIPALDKQLEMLNQQIADKQTYKINLRDEVSKDIKSKRGFLDELKVLRKVLFEDNIALLVWLLLFIFFFSLELFVLINKLSDSKLDYDKIVTHQLETKVKMLENLSK
jgi:hypothetical protein